MEKNNLFLCYTEADSVKSEGEWFGKAFKSIYIKFSRTRKRKKFESLLKQLIVQRNELDVLIQSIQDYLSFELEKNNHAEKNLCYHECLDRLYYSIADQVSFLIMDLADTAKSDANVRPSDVNHYLSFVVSEFVADSMAKKLVDIPEVKSDHWNTYITYFCDPKLISERLFINNYIERTLALYKVDYQDDCLNVSAADRAALTFRVLLSKHIFTWRKNNNVSQSVLADECEIDRTTIAKIETLKQSASLETMFRLLSVTDAGLMILPYTKK